MPKFLTHIEGTENLLAQGSPEWRELRMGRATASSFDRILSEATGQWKTGRTKGTTGSAEKYAREVAVQRLLKEDTEKPIDGLYWVERGKKEEPNAVKHYETVRGRTTDAIGIIISDDGTRACSPDRISTDRLWGVEIKVPSAAQHLQYMVEGPGADYRWQVVGSILVSGFDGWDFVSYSPNLKEVIIPYRREDYLDDIEALDRALIRFEALVQEYCDIMKRDGIVEVLTGSTRSDSEWQRMLEADSGMWALG
ncbi:MAG TPA: YqaJ viral recombinase family protein [Verrucomicrobiae bacterium]|nr:YqaJ viral recombinase family protein [Verrucomicrobiae bacterium]